MYVCLTTTCFLFSDTPSSLDVNMTQLSQPTVCDEKSKQTKRKCNKRRKLSFLSKVSRFVTLSRAPQRKKSSKLDRSKSRRVTIREREKYAADKTKASTVGEEDEFPECLSEDEDEPSLNVVRERLGPFCDSDIHGLHQ